MRKKVKIFKVLKTPKRCFTFNFSFLLTPFLLGGGTGWGGLFTPLYLLNNFYCEIFFKCLQIVRFVVDSKYFRPQTLDLERGCSGILAFLKYLK